MKIVLNRDYGGYSLSQAAANFLGLEPIEKWSWITTPPSYGAYNEDRTNPLLIECIEKLGDEANGFGAKLEIIDIPDEATDYIITNYDGWESLIYVIDGKIFQE